MGINKNKKYNNNNKEKFKQEEKEEEEEQQQQHEEENVATIEEYSDNENDINNDNNENQSKKINKPIKIVQFLINENNNNNNNNNGDNIQSTDSETETKRILKKVKEELKNEELNNNSNFKNYPPHSIKPTKSFQDDEEDHIFDSNITEINSSSEHSFINKNNKNKKSSGNFNNISNSSGSGSNRLFEDDMGSIGSNVNNSNSYYEDGDDERDETPSSSMTPISYSGEINNSNNIISSTDDYNDSITPTITRVGSLVDLSKRDKLVTGNIMDSKEVADVVEASLNISDASINISGGSGSGSGQGGDSASGSGQGDDNSGGGININKSTSSTTSNTSNTSTTASKIQLKKSMENIVGDYNDLTAFQISLSEKRNLFIAKVVQKVLNTLKKASSDDLSTSQKDHIIEEIFKDISLEVDEPVFEYLTTFDEKDIEKVNKDQLKKQQQQQQNQQNQQIITNRVYHPYPCLDRFSKRQKTTVLNSSTSSQQTIDSPILSPTSNHYHHHSSSSSNSSSSNSNSSSGNQQSREIYYYQLISQYFINNPDKVELFRPLLYSLWTNNQWFYLIYASMFYSWLLEYRLSLISQLNVLIKSSNRLFWYDCDHYTRKYYDVYLTIKKKLLDRSLWNGLCEASNSNNKLDPDTVRSNLLRNRRIWIDFYHIVCVFYFYYERTNDSINEFRSNISKQYQDFILDITQKKLLNASTGSSGSGSGSNSNSPIVLSTDDLFVRGIIKQVSLIKREETLIRYIEKCLVFRNDWNLNPTTKVKLQSCLYSLTKPGSPAYVPRSVRTKSRSVLDQLFPDGKFSRNTVNLFFRLLHPYYSIQSIFHWGFSIIKTYIPFLDRNNNNNNNNNNTIKSPSLNNSYYK